MRISKASQRASLEKILVEFRNEAKVAAVLFDGIVNFLDLDKMSLAQMRGVELLLNHALTCLCEARDN